MTQSDRRRNEIMAEIEATIMDIDCYASANSGDIVYLLKELERQLWSRYAKVPV
jgi:DNA-binding PadR family transcriptional regulator